MRWLTIPATLLALVQGARAADLLSEGSPFPAWELTDHRGQRVRSQDLLGKTYLLWFYPKAMTPGCTREGCELRDNFHEFQRLGVEVLGVSFDSPAENARFVAEHRFPFRLLSDETRQLAVQVGAADNAKQLWSRRISYLVGPDGRVIKAYPKVNPSTHAQEVLKDLQALRGQ
ncbi:MAG: peroxiredoxin [Thermoanaerobaculum sp.]|nr:peroxiredoxin [Thermoanaerobaculum sp.]MDW7968544.1 peroxiredoxin [Thermoanaerobaculum sp.]